MGVFASYTGPLLPNVHLRTVHFQNQFDWSFDPWTWSCYASTVEGISHRLCNFLFFSEIIGKTIYWLKDFKN